ncbi:MAG TPA: serine hydrolase domain-containing protein [Burkholderiales bacterium]|nr:serine hydrolase domain-containing protein [Burkholderiales bacterium]
MRIGLLAAVVASFIAAGCAAPRALDAGKVGALEQAFAAEIANKKIPGAVILVARDGKVAYEKALGAQDPVTGAPMRMDSIFRIYSMTKPVVSVVAMQLVEEGRIRLDDPVAQTIPELKGLRVGVEKDGKLEIVPAQREMTIRDLLRHTSGFTYGVFGKGMVKTLYGKEGVDDTNITNAELVRRLAKVPLMHQPGTVWEYGRSTDVLGHLIERVTGQPLDAVLEARVFKPLKMADTGFWVPLGKLDRVAEAFDKDPESAAAYRLLQVRYKPTYLAGGQGLVSTARDYLRFAQMLANGGELAGVRILKAESVAEMTRNQLGTIKGPSPAYGFGLGFAVRLTDDGSTTPGRAGEYNWSGVGGTTFWVDPKEGLVAILMTQGPNQRMHTRVLFRKQVYGALGN